MRGWGLFFFLLFLLLIFAVGGWVGYTQWAARKQGLPAPSLKSWKTYVPFMKTQGSSNYPAPRHAGPLEWIRDQFAKLGNRRTARGAYEEAGDGETGYAGARRGRGVEDDAWDTRVGNDDPYAPGPGYGGYEEQELGLAATPGLQSEPYASDHADGMDRGRRSSRTGGLDPFGDQNEAPSLRSVSPRPEGDSQGHTKGNPSLDTQGSGDGSSSPISTRKSVFRENMS
ncbi:hypothetical protein PV08_00841 [Exophiala spinifera]|uniref:Uncharacterized protein n=1 Tax=Exophiala spinifera TaxID=91928 RepID=A0A0D1YYA2_9EURO|nr:uncharacterized protein PV08_00841 [Exophiala spinifera]KIW20266.1 hypothetical protein PV08_00841 [Exophiala spinifera]